MPKTTASRMYLGIDPSARSAGLALIGPNGGCEIYLVRPPRGITEIARLAFHRDALLEFLRDCAVQHACVEGPSLGSVNRPDTLGQIRGTYILALHDLKIPTTVVAPKSNKKVFTGSGGASKEKMIETAQQRWPGIKFNEDTADAAGLAVVARALIEGTYDLTRKMIEGLSVVREGRKIKTPSPRVERGLNI
jgi:Holliday junction resolvasome RuvABC endonuclease subunit